MNENDWTITLTLSALTGKTDFTGVPLSAKIGYILGRPIGLVGIGLGIVSSKLPITRDFVKGVCIGVTTMVGESAINKVKEEVQQGCEEVKRNANEIFNKRFSPI